MKKLTAVTISSQGRKITKFLHLEQTTDSRGRHSGAYISREALDRMLEALHVRKGQTFSVG